MNKRKQIVTAAVDVASRGRNSQLQRRQLEKEKKSLFFTTIISCRHDQKIHETEQQVYKTIGKVLAKSIRPQKYNLREAHLNIPVFYHLATRSASIHGAEVLLRPRAIKTVKAPHRPKIYSTLLLTYYLRSCGFLYYVRRWAALLTRFKLEITN